MENVLAAVVIIFLILFSVMTLSDVFIATQDSLHDTWQQAETRMDDQSHTSIRIVTAETDCTGRVLTVTLANEGSTRLSDFDDWDVIVQYDSTLSVGGYVVEYVPFNQTAVPNALPYRSVTTPFFVGELNTTAIGSADLAGIDPDDTDTSHLIYSVTLSPAFGALELNSVALNTGDLFTQADIDSGRLSYMHAGGGQPDSFSFTLADVQTLTISATSWQIYGLYMDASSDTPEAFEPDVWNPGEELVVSIQLDPPAAPNMPIQTVLAMQNGINVSTVLESGTTYLLTIEISPFVETNSGLTLPNGGSTTLDTSQLRAVANGQTPDTVLYTITTPPLHGTLSLNPIFTQAQIDSGLLTYQHDGGGLADSFTFTVSDGQRNTGQHVFEIAVN